MLQIQIIGRIGADAVVNTGNGKSFASFRVCHSRRFITPSGEQRVESVWADCALSFHGGIEPPILRYLTKGRLVAVDGVPSLRVYSSRKDRCMKAGLNIAISHVELLADESRLVPRVLFDADGCQHDVTTLYWCADVKSATLFSKQNSSFVVDEQGFVTPITGALNANANE